MPLFAALMHRLTIGLLGLVIAAMPYASAETPFRVGVAPHTSARVIVAQYQPLRAALEQALGVPVVVVTARDFTAFAQNALSNDYDLAITTAHQAALLRDDAGFVPLLTYRADFEALAIVAQSGAMQSPADLQGRPVLGLNPASLVTLWGTNWLRQQQVRAQPMRYITASDSVAELVLSGEAAAGFVSLANLQRLPEPSRLGLRILARSGPIPGRVYLLAPRHLANEVLIRKTLASFAESAPAKAYFEENKLGGYRPIGANELDAMRPYADAVRGQLRDGK
jgi:phosphonate transport system substrate-binding protein